MVFDAEDGGALGLVDRVPRLAVINAKGARTLDTVFNIHGVRWNSGRYFTDGGQTKVDAEYARMDAANERAKTIASAIEINRPVNLAKALRALEVMNGQGSRSFDASNPVGVVRSVDDDTIRHYKALVGRHGFGCEPASACSVAGAHMLRQEGLIKADHTVACILTGHVLKDPDITVNYHTASPPTTHGNAPVKVPNDLGAILKAMGAG